MTRAPSLPTLFRTTAVALACVAAGSAAQAQSSVQAYGLVDVSVGEFQNAGGVKLKREDSGNIFEWIPYGIEALRKNGVDAREKICMPSDGLTIEKMIEIHEAFHDKVKLVFGVGTHLSFDFGETVKPVSIVVKMTECNNLGVVKLSNNISKAIGNPEDLELFKRTFGYTSEYREECKV